MHDKTIRRRRAVLLGLVVGSLLLLTASFGDSAGGGLGAVQRGVSTVLTPVQEGASRALKPVRDGVGWVGDTFDAKKENKRLREELAQVRASEIDGATAAQENVQLRNMLGMNDRLQLRDRDLVAARVIGRAPTVLNQVIRINKGTGDGVRSGQPVITGNGLVGKVDTVTSNSASVTLVTDADFGAGVKVADSGISGTLRPSAGRPRELRMDDTDANDEVRKGDQVVTSGTSDPEFPSPFPPDVPIGRVTDVVDPGSDTQVIRVRPFVDVRDVDFVEVVTKTDPGIS